MTHSVARLIDRLEPYSHVIWDWNGTLLDDVEVSVEVISELLVSHGLSALSRDAYRAAFGFPVRDYYRKIGFDFERTPFEKVGDEFIRQYTGRVREARLFTGVEAMLSALSARGTRNAILSAASQWHLDEVTAHFGIRGYFSHIYGIDNHYAGSKLERGRELLKEAGFPLDKTILVGDTDHDLAVGKELGLDVLLVADGHQDYSRLKAKHSFVLSTRFSE